MSDGGAGNETAVSEPGADAGVDGDSSTPGVTDAGADADNPTPAIRPAPDGTIESSTEPPGELLEYTTERRSLSATVQIQWGVRATIVGVVGGVVLTVLLTNFGLPAEAGPGVVGVLITLLLLWVVLRYRRWTYQVRGDDLSLERGVVTHVRTLVPFVRIQHVDTSQGPLERALGLSTLVVYTAGSRGADVSIPGLTLEEARDLQQRVKELAIEAEGGDAL